MWKNPPTDSGYTEDEADSDSDDNKDIYCPENGSDSYGSDSEAELNATQMNFHENETERHKQPKFTPFQNQLLLLLSICLACFSKELAVNHIVKGSILTAYIKCLCFKTVREWKSQPKVRNYAAGDILLSGVALFNGLLPNKFSPYTDLYKDFLVCPHDLFSDIKGNFCMEQSEMFEQNNK